MFAELYQLQQAVSLHAFSPLMCLSLGLSLGLCLCLRLLRCHDLHAIC